MKFSKKIIYSITGSVVPGSESTLPPAFTGITYCAPGVTPSEAGGKRYLLGFVYRQKIISCRVESTSCRSADTDYSTGGAFPAWKI
jgi:hypothetical protein